MKTQTNSDAANISAANYSIDELQNIVAFCQLGFDVSVERAGAAWDAMIEFWGEDNTRFHVELTVFAIRAELAA